jgi:hypothetical protein
MKLNRVAQASALCVLLAHCGGDDGAGGGSGARIQTQLTAAGGTSTSDKFRSGAATLESLRYYITTIMICETLDVQGSGFNNPGGCIELYSRDIGALAYGLNDDWRPLGDIARRSDDGFIDLVSASSRASLAGSTLLTHEHAHAYNYGIIGWALPIKVRASVPFTDGTTLYTHDGVSSFEAIGVDNYRSYFTAASTPLDRAPAEDAVVLLPNGGNWFKFQTPLSITPADIDERREFVLDLVFNPEGIVNGYAEAGAQGSLSQRGAAGSHVFDITVPMLDLAPVPHRADQQVVRESYRGTTQVDGSPFDIRIELYSVQGESAVYGADMKSLLNGASTQVPPQMAKASFVDQAADGSLSISSWKHTPVVTGLRRAAAIGGTAHVAVSCATHADRAAVEGGSAIVSNACPTPTIDVTLTLVSRNIVEGSIPTAVGAGPADAGLDGGTVDASSLIDAH